MVSACPRPSRRGIYWKAPHLNPRCLPQSQGSSPKAKWRKAASVPFLPNPGQSRWVSGPQAANWAQTKSWGPTVDSNFGSLGEWGVHFRKLKSQTLCLSAALSCQPQGGHLLGPFGAPSEAARPSACLDWGTSRPGPLSASQLGSLPPGQAATLCSLLAPSSLSFWGARGRSLGTLRSPQRSRAASRPHLGDAEY